MLFVCVRGRGETMFREFLRLALIPLIVAATIGGVIAWLTRSLDEPTRSILLGGAGAIGGSIGATLLQARSRIEERKRAYSVLAVTLRALETGLESDLRMLAHPLATPDGRIPNTLHLIAYAERALRSTQKAYSLAEPKPNFEDEVNAEIVKLAGTADSMIPILEAVVASARAHPATVEQFLIPLAPTYKDLDVIWQHLLGVLASVLNRLDADRGITK
jgi:hypothetical protein